MFRKFFHIDKYGENKFCIYLFGIKVFDIKFKTKPLTLEQIKNIQKSYASIEKRLQARIKQGRKIKVAFLVGLSSMFPARPLFESLLKNKNFAVSLIVIPDYRFNVEEGMKKTIADLKKYKSVMIISPTDKETDTLNLKEIADIVFPSIPYDVSHSKYNLIKLIEQGLLPAIVNYGYFRSYYDRLHLISNERFSLFWKIFVETGYNMEEYKNYQLIKGQNTVLTGYCKMDALANHLSDTKGKRKTILIAPHHSVAGGYNDVLCLSNFQRYADLFLKLPEMFPSVDFIFRPHPALFPCLSKDKFWGKDRTARYITKMKCNSNVTYSDKGDYFHEFAISDGIIQDCGSYLVEYFYTKKPCCYMLKSPSDIETKFTKLGQRCLQNCYIAYDERAILDFIKNVIIEEKDEMKEAREKFAVDEIMLNFPNVSEVITDYLQNYFGTTIQNKRTKNETNNYVWNI